MGALDLWRSMSRTAVDVRPESITGLPWQQPQNKLTQFVIDDVFGQDLDIIDRAAALRVPSIARARALIVGAIADLPLVAYRDQAQISDQPTWAYRSLYTSLWHRNALTIDDLIFYDQSLWWRINGEAGQLLDAWRVPYDAWDVDDQGRILVNDTTGTPQPVGPNDVIYIPGPGTPLLDGGVDTIRGARSLERAWMGRVRSPIPPTLFKATESETATADEVRELLKAWSAARRDPDSSAVGYIPYGLDAIFPEQNSSGDSDLFIEGRNAVRLDVANLTNIPASLLDGSTATASLTYVTVDGQRSSFHEQTIRYWTAPLEHRLSMDDVVPRGQRVRFDITYSTQEAPAGEPGKD